MAALHFTYKSKICNTQANNQCKHITFGMVTKGVSEVPVDQSDPIFAVAEGAGTETVLFCTLSIP